MKKEKGKLLGKKPIDKYKGWILPPDSWITIQRMCVENGEIKVWNKR